MYGLILALALAAPASPGPGLMPPAAKDWVTIVETSNTVSSFLMGSVEIDMPSSSVQFLMRTTFNTPISANVHALVEQMVALCDDDKLVRVTQVRMNGEGESTGIDIKPKVFVDEHNKGQVISEIMKEMCPHHKGASHDEDEEVPAKNRT